MVIDIKDKSVPEAANTTTFPTDKYAAYQQKVVDNDRVIVASACSGHGFKHSAALGEMLAEMALTGQHTDGLGEFLPRPASKTNCWRRSAGCWIQQVPDKLSLVDGVKV